MVRFIFFCMAVMALSLAAIPFTTAVDGISGERADLIAAVEPAATDEPDVFADVVAEPSVDDLNAIESAAGGFEGGIEDGRLTGGFGTTPPKALAEDAAAPTADVAPATPQDN